jgi:hypothetical protein
MCGVLSCSWPNLGSVPDPVAVIVRLAEQIGRQFPAPVAQDLEQEAVFHVYQRAGQFRANRGLFEPWCACLLRNLGFDLCRKWQRRRRRFASLEVIGEVRASVRKAPEDFSEVLLADSATLRGLLDARRWRPQPNDKVDLYAVLLLHLRLVAAARGGKVFSKAGLHREEGMHAFVSGILPWRTDEEELCFREGFPTLARLWSALEDDVNRLPCHVGNLRLCQVLSGFLDAGTRPPSLQVWAKWCDRARRRARQQFGEEAWQHYLGCWLPRNSSAREPATQGV